MAKTRVYKLAKELGVKSALILELLDLIGREVRSDLSTLDDETADLVRARIRAALEAERQRLEEEQDVGTPPEEDVAEPQPPAAVDEQAEEGVAETVAAEGAAEPVEEAPAEEPPAEIEEPAAAPAAAAAPASEIGDRDETPLAASAPTTDKPTVAAMPSTATSELRKKRPEPPKAPAQVATRTARATSIPAPPGAKRPKRVFEAKVIPSKTELRQRLQRAARPTVARPGRPRPGGVPGAGVPPTTTPGGPAPGRAEARQT